jgi:predicted RNA-binding protein Jag
MTDKVEIQGKTVDEAVSEALLQMGARRDEVDVTVLEEPKSGFLGLLGGRPARVVVRKRRGGSGRPDFRRNADGHTPHSLDGGASGRGQGDRRRSAARPARDGDGTGGDGARKGRGGGRGGQRDDSRQDAEGREGGSRRRGRRGGRRGRGRGGNRPEGAEAARDQRSQGGQNGQGDQGEGRDRREPSRRETASSDRPARGGTSRRRGRRGGRRGRDRDRDDSRQTSPETKARPETAPDGAPNEEVRAPERTAAPPEAPQPEQQRTAPAPAEERRTERPAAARVDEQRPEARNMGPEEEIVSDVAALRYAKPLEGGEQDDTDETLTRLASGMLVRAGFPCRCEVKPGEYRLVKVVTDDASAGMLIGRHGQTVDAVEHLVERMAHTVAGERVLMNLDINNYRRRREETLVDRVADAISTVRSTGEEFHMEPMSARERRIVHLEAETAGLHTRTEPGQGGKHVIIGLAPMSDADPMDDNDDDDDQEDSPDEIRTAATTEAPDPVEDEEAAPEAPEEEPRTDA